MDSLWVFLDIKFSPTTWFYLSGLLAIALFFKFARLLSMRNWDVLTLFLLVPGLLVIRGTRHAPIPVKQHPAIQIATTVGLEAGPVLRAPLPNIAGAGTFIKFRDPTRDTARWLWWGYLWLLCGSGYFLLRCLLDLTLVQRPALAPNLTFGGLAWFAASLMVCLVAVAYMPADQPPSSQANPTMQAPNPITVAPVGRESASLAHVQKWLERSFAVLGQLAVVLGLLFIGRWHFQDTTSGMAAATFYLMLPYAGLFAGQAHHVWPMALVVWALAVYRLPTLAGALLGLAAGTMYFPGLLLPIWLSFYWKRGAGRFLIAFLLAAGLALAAIGFVLWLQGDLDGSIREALQQAAWQPWKVPTTEGFWTGVHFAYRIPVFIAYVAFFLLTAAWPWPKNLAQVIPLSAALLIGLQFWYADQGGAYALWYLPLLLLLVFRPNLDDRRPALIQSENDWLAGLGRSLQGSFRRLVHGQETVRTS